MGNLSNKEIQSKELSQALKHLKPSFHSQKLSHFPKAANIQPIIVNKAKWRCFSPTDPSFINKSKPKMLSTIHLTRFEYENIKAKGLKILSKSLKDSKRVSTLLIDHPEGSTSKPLAQLLNLTHRWKKLKLHYNQTESLISEQTAKKATRLRRCSHLTSLEISFDEQESNEVKEKIMSRLSQQIRGLPNLKDFTFNIHSLQGVLRRRADVDHSSIFLLKYPRSLSSITLKLNCSQPLPQQLLFQFTSIIQHLNLLEHLDLDFDILSTNVEPLFWTMFFQKTQRLQSLRLYKHFYDNLQQSEASLAFLQGLSYLTNLNSLDIHFLYCSGEIQAKIFIHALSNRLASFPHLKSLTFSFSTPRLMGQNPSAELPDILPSIHHLTQLEQLRLNFASIRSANTFFEDFAQSLRHLRNLKHLKFSVLKADLSPQFIVFLIESLQRLTCIKILNLHFPYININYSSMEALAKSIAGLHLTHLSLIFDKPKPAKTILQAIGSLWEDTQRLTSFFSALYGFNRLSNLSLDLSSFDLSIPEFKHFALALREFQQLTVLSLNLSEFRNFETLKSVLSSLTNLPRLTSLTLGFRNKGFRGKEIRQIASRLGDCKSLENLELRFFSGDHFDEEIFHCLLLGIANLSLLRNLAILIHGSPKFDLLNAQKLLLQELVALRSLETLIFNCSFYFVYSLRDFSPEVSPILREKLRRNHQSFKRLVRLVMNYSQYI